MQTNTIAILETLKNIPAVRKELDRVESEKVDRRRELIEKMETETESINADLLPLFARESELVTAVAELRAGIEAAASELEDVRTRAIKLGRRMDAARRDAITELERTSNPRLNTLSIWVAEVRNIARMAASNSQIRAHEGDGSWVDARELALRSAERRIKAECARCHEEAAAMRRKAVPTVEVEAFIDQWFDDLTAICQSAGIKPPAMPDPA